MHSSGEQTTALEGANFYKIKQKIFVLRPFFHAVWSIFNNSFGQVKMLFVTGPSFHCETGAGDGTATPLGQHTTHTHVSTQRCCKPHSHEGMYRTWLRYRVQNRPHWRRITHNGNPIELGITMLRRKRNGLATHCFLLLLCVSCESLVSGKQETLPKCIADSLVYLSFWWVLDFLVEEPVSLNCSLCNVCQLYTDNGDGGSRYLSGLWLPYFILNEKR